MEAKKARGDIILYAVLSVLGFVFYKYIIPGQVYMSLTASAEAFSPDTFPNAVTILFTGAAVCGLILAIIRYIKAIRVEGKPQKGSSKKAKNERIGDFMPLIVFALCLLYVILFGWLGFIPATILVPPVILYVIGCRKWNYYPIYYAFAAAMYLLFRFILLVPIR